MRNLLLILLLLTSLSLIAQTRLNGKWQEHPNNALYEKVYNFNRDGTFSYYYIDDLLEGSEGRGVYEIVKDKLIINFTEFPDVKKDFDTSESVIILDTLYSYDSVVYDLKVVDKQNEQPLVGSTVSVRDSSDILIDGKICDIYGKARLCYHKSLNPLNIQVGNVTYKVYNIPINSKSSFKAQIELVKRPDFEPNLKKIKEGEVWEYYIDIDEINGFMYLRKNSTEKWEKLKKF